VGKTNFTTSPPGKFLKNSPSGTPLEKSFRRPWLPLFVYVCLSGGSRPGVLGEKSNRGAPKGLHSLEYQRLSATIVGCHTKVVTFCRPKCGYFCWSNYAIFQGIISLKAFYIINSENVWNGSQTVGLIFHKLLISRISTKCI